MSTCLKQQQKNLIKSAAEQMLEDREACLITSKASAVSKISEAVNEEIYQSYDEGSRLSIDEIKEEVTKQVELLY